MSKMIKVVYENKTYNLGTHINSLSEIWDKLKDRQVRHNNCMESSLVMTNNSQQITTHQNNVSPLDMKTSRSFNPLSSTTTTSKYSPLEDEDETEQEQIITYWVIGHGAQVKEAEIASKHINVHQQRQRAATEDTIDVSPAVGNNNLNYIIAHNNNVPILLKQQPIQSMAEYWAIVGRGIKCKILVKRSLINKSNKKNNNSYKKCNNQQGNNQKANNQKGNNQKGNNQQGNKDNYTNNNSLPNLNQQSQQPYPCFFCLAIESENGIKFRFNDCQYCQNNKIISHNHPIIKLIEEVIKRKDSTKKYKSCEEGCNKQQETKIKAMSKQNNTHLSVLNNQNNKNSKNNQNNQTNRTNMQNSIKNIIVPTQTAPTNPNVPILPSKLQPTLRPTPKFPPLFHMTNSQTTPPQPILLASTLNNRISAIIESQPQLFRLKKNPFYYKIQLEDMGIYEYNSNDIDQGLLADIVKDMATHKNHHRRL